MSARLPNVGVLDAMLELAERLDVSSFECLSEGYGLGVLVPRGTGTLTSEQYTEDAPQKQDPAKLPSSQITTARTDSAPKKIQEERHLIPTEAAPSDLTNPPIRNLPAIQPQRTQQAQTPPTMGKQHRQAHPMNFRRRLGSYLLCHGIDIFIIIGSSLMLLFALGYIVDPSHAGFNEQQFMQWRPVKLLKAQSFAKIFAFVYLSYFIYLGFFRIFLGNTLGSILLHRPSRRASTDRVD